MKTLTIKDFKIPALLVLLSLIPTLGGVVRVSSLLSDAPVGADNARFLAAPVPIAIHVIASLLYCLIGAFQFSKGLRVRWPGAHRRAGRVLAVAGVLSGLSGLWMTVFSAIPSGMQGPLTFGARLLAGLGMVTSIVMAWRVILRRDVDRHEAFMIRAYALAQGAGTQALVLGPWMLITGESQGATRDVLMALSWVINALAAEWVIARRRRSTRPSAPRLDVSTAQL